MSETSSRHRGAEGSVKLIMPISAVEGTKIQLSGGMGDREVSFRPTNDPGQVEVTIGTVNGGERRYLKSGSQSSRPTRSSGSTRHATRGGAEGWSRFANTGITLSVVNTGAESSILQGSTDEQRRRRLRVYGVYGE
ncbi:unnamed protein product [Aureobasidium pullulans]|nr:unnamed protein product [Aureobasidium pullulans]